MRKSYTIVMLLGLSAAACSSSQTYTASPIPALLNDRQAVALANAKLNEEVVTPRQITRLERQPWGYLVGYRTPFSMTGKPPTEAILVAVHNDGTVEPWRFAD